MKIVANIVPKGQMRSRSRAFKAKKDGKMRSMNYKDPKQVREEEKLKEILSRDKPSEAMQGPLLLGVRVYLPIPESKPKLWKTEAVAGRIRPTSTPDLDNLLKHVTDCLSKLQFWRDDRQVVGYLPHTGKYYSDRPRWEIEIVEIPGGR